MEKETSMKVDTHQVLTELSQKLPNGVTTKNKTAVLKEVKKANSGEAPRLFWTCWCTDANGNKFIALYADGALHKLMPENKWKEYSFHAVK